MRGDEARVVAQFGAWLRGAGWRVETEVDFCDVVASRDGQVLYAEAKGRTTAPGLDVDTLYGQLLRRMLPLPSGDGANAGDVEREVRYGVVVPQAARFHALRVPEAVRGMLRIDVYVVSEQGSVEVVAAPHL
ncbi:hypothetical protein [Kineococcus arenarius]|uniref:hypothetical protein n=1 Tax=Kineococcus sp. SYSU DK007 TaxID=3383128 RepID=UPI003D7E71A5